MAVLCLLLGCLCSASAQQTSTTPTGTISGLVVDIHGAVVSGASIQLVSSNSTSTQRTSSGADGSFAFEHVPAGEFTLSVDVQGFVPASVTGSLQPGQVLHLAPVALHLAAAVFEVRVTPESSSEQQILIEEDQRLLGFVPNFFVTYDWKAPPLTPRQKFALAWANGRDPGNLFLVGAVAGVQQADNAFSGYGQGAQGYGKRYGADLANLEVGTFMGGAVFPMLFHQDPRYFYKGTGTIRSRILYALSSAVICRGDDGRRQPAFAGVLGDLSAGAISNLYYPAANRNGAALTFENGFLGVAGDALNGIFQEFVLRKFTPHASKPTPQTP